MSMKKKEDHWLLDRRAFLKATGAGIAGVAMGAFPFESFTFDEAMAAAAKAGETAIPTFCAMCGPAANCGVYAFTKNGRFTKVAGMKESPANNGSLCPKGQASPQWVYSGERLKYPLKRVGKKGE
jgi:anaerobic selenocysteine-containing dehydrogenase